MPAENGESAIRQRTYLVYVRVLSRTLPCMYHLYCCTSYLYEPIVCILVRRMLFACEESNLLRPAPTSVAPNKAFGLNVVLFRVSLLRSFNHPRRPDPIGRPTRQSKALQKRRVCVCVRYIFKSELRKLGRFGGAISSNQHTPASGRILLSRGCWHSS